MKKMILKIIKAVFKPAPRKAAPTIRRKPQADSAPGASLLNLRGKKLAQAMISDPHFLERYEAAASQQHDSGLVDGKHYSAFVDEVKALKRAQDHDAAAGLLLRLIDAVEEESRVGGKECAVAPWYYEQLAIIYRKEKDYKNEASVLRRYVLQHKGKRDKPSETVMVRLKKAQSLEVAATIASKR